MPSDYPAALDGLPTNKTNGTAAKDDHAANHNDANSAINAVQGTLGTNPQGEEETVAARLEGISTTIAGLVSADAVVYKGALDCSANPNYPAADAGHLYRVSVAGRIGGGSGPKVEVGDTLLCHADGSSAGTHASVGANWAILQVNIDGAVVGPTSATDSRVAVFDGTTGKLIKDGGVVLSALSLKTELTAHSEDTTDVHGIADTSKLATTSSAGVMPAIVGCLVRRTTNQTIEKEKVAVLSWSSEVYDDGGCWDGANPSRLVVPAGQGGLWAISWSAVVLPSGMTGEKELWFRLNGDETRRLGTEDFTSTADMQCLTVITRLEAGDYVECCGYLETSENGQFADDEYGVGDDLQRCRFERIR